MAVKSVLEGKWMLQDLRELIDWTRMRFKPAKSRSLVLKKGKLQDRNIRIRGKITPTIMEMQVKSLGKWFRNLFNAIKSTNKLVSQAGKWRDINGNLVYPRSTKHGAIIMRYYQESHGHC